MKDRAFIILILLSLSISVLASDLKPEGYAAYLNDGESNFLLGVGFSFAKKNYTHSLRFAGFGETVKNSDRGQWPDRYLLVYNLDGFHFYPGLGFVKNNFDLFRLSDAGNLNGTYGGMYNVYAALLTVTAQLKLMKVPEGFSRKAFELTSENALATTDPFLSLYDMREGISAYGTLRYKSKPNAIYEGGYFGNFTGNSLNNLWLKWLIPDFAYGSAAFGAGVEMGEMGFVPPGLYFLADYSVPLNNLLSLSLSMCYGSLRKDQNWVFDAHSSSRLSLLLDTDTSQLTLVSGWESLTNQGWSGENQTGYGDFKWKIEYLRKDSWPFKIFASKDTKKDFSLGLSYKF